MNVLLSVQTKRIEVLEIVSRSRGRHTETLAWLGLAWLLGANFFSWLGLAWLAGFEGLAWLGLALGFFLI